jgi:hypothetical protein
MDHSKKFIAERLGKLQKLSCSASRTNDSYKAEIRLGNSLELAVIGIIQLGPRSMRRPTSVNAQDRACYERCLVGSQPATIKCLSLQPLFTIKGHARTRGMTPQSLPGWRNDAYRESGLVNFCKQS